jgi:hypothetical protein
MPTLRELLRLDLTIIDTDWNDIHALWDDMKKFGHEGQGIMFTCADDPGCSYDPPRIPRLGWIAYIDNPATPLKTWTITIRKLLATFKRETNLADPSLSSGN